MQEQQHEAAEGGAQGRGPAGSQAERLEQAIEQPIKEALEHPEQTRERLREAGERIRRQLSKPGVGATVAGAALVAAAAVAGVSEAIVAGLGAWAVYRILERRRAKSHA